ncbi:hypothetical protein CGL27_33555 [Streptomyces sp. 11-1-2]|nr:hypothetical protein CGL27_33555 [Streptomyces sp. 11-1-2]
MDGVSTYLALTFGTLLSSQGTDASFETVSPVSPGASLRCFQPYQIRFPFRFRSEFRFRWPLEGLPFRCPRLYQNFSESISTPAGGLLRRPLSPPGSPLAEP